MAGQVESTVDTNKVMVDATVDTVDATVDRVDTVDAIVDATIDSVVIDVASDATEELSSWRAAMHRAAQNALDAGEDVCEAGPGVAGDASRAAPVHRVLDAAASALQALVDGRGDEAAVDRAQAQSMQDFERELQLDAITRAAMALTVKSALVSEFSDDDKNALAALIHGLTLTFTKADATPLLAAIKAAEDKESAFDAAITTAGSLVCVHPDYDQVARHLHLAQLYEGTPDSFGEAVELLAAAGLLNDGFVDLVRRNVHAIEDRIQQVRDTLLTYFGHKTLEKGYLMHIRGKTIERPQYMFMRVSLAIHGDDLDAAFETYDLMSTKRFVHATPTLFNAGTKRQQLSSCYLLQIKDDSIESINYALLQCSLISKFAGGIGMCISNIRCEGAPIQSTNGRSTGIVPMLKVFDAMACYVNQAGKRNGSYAVYLEPWHKDVVAFLQLRKTTGAAEKMRTRDLFTAMWLPDLFMRRVKEDGEWTLMCPSECPGLADVWGDKFEELYLRYEGSIREPTRMKARALWLEIARSQQQTGLPYLLFKDTVNRKSNQQHLGTIKCGNLCTEIVEYCSPGEVAVCNLASLGLPSFVRGGAFDFDELHRVTKIVTRNLNKVIDLNFYPVEEARASNTRHRPIGVGVQGLADVFAMLKLPFESEGARRLNEDIFETMYHAALEASVELARVHGAHSSFEGSPASRGVLQFDLWGKSPGSRRYDWQAMREDVMKDGLRNSLLLAPMPTASTSQILGYNEAFEPYTSNLYKRLTLAGEHIIFNEHLVRDLEALGLWSEDMRTAIVAGRGSVKNISGIPAELKQRYKTSWEISQKTVMDMAAERGKYICQSQSLNIFMDGEEVDIIQRLYNATMYAWEIGLKTAFYYLHTRAPCQTQQFTLEPVAAKEKAARDCQGDEACIMCAS